ncbi:hypothetical protein RJT34_24195 [Clitoria ternatea]|uniref:Uncharacterized protein n=1 Tax=Clitoria ternatea TaxID=43366 RepID=A0AAN9FML7_CLITE
MVCGLIHLFRFRVCFLSSLFFYKTLFLLPLFLHLSPSPLPHPHKSPATVCHFSSDCHCSRAISSPYFANKYLGHYLSINGSHPPSLAATRGDSSGTQPLRGLEFKVVKT